MTCSPSSHLLSPAGQSLGARRSDSVKLRSTRDTTRSTSTPHVALRRRRGSRGSPSMATWREQRPGRVVELVSQRSSLRPDLLAKPAEDARLWPYGPDQAIPSSAATSRGTSPRARRPRKAYQLSARHTGTSRGRGSGLRAKAGSSTRGSPRVHPPRPGRESRGSAGDRRGTPGPIAMQVGDLVHQDTEHPGA